jgi:uncharacterized membrane protein
MALLVCTFTCVYALPGVFRHRHFDSSYDLAIFDQVVWHLSRFELPASSIRGYSNILGDHFHPMIALFVPFYWIAPAAETLIVAQAVFLAASIVPVFLFLRQRFTLAPAVALCVAYGFFWGLQRTANYDVHELAFAPLIIATAIYALDRTKWRLLWVSCCLLALVKEDLIPIITFMGLFLVASGDWKRGLSLTMTSLVLFVAVLRLVIPYFSGVDRYNYADAYADILTQPWLIPARLVTPPAKLETALLWLAPFVVMPLWSPLSLLLVPLALERFLSTNSHHWGTSFHYSAPVAPILAMSAGDGLSRIARRLTQTNARTRLIVGVTGASILLSSLLPGRQPMWRLVTPKHYRATSVERTGRLALEMIPGDASVVAQAAILPHVSQRTEVYRLDTAATDAEFIVASAALDPWPLQSHAEMSALIDGRRQRGYAVVFEREGWLVLRRAPQPSR